LTQHEAIGVQLNGLLEMGCGFIEASREELGVSKALPALRIERIQVNSSEVQLKRLVKPAEQGRRTSRLLESIRTSRRDSDCPLVGSIRSSPIEIDLLLDPAQLPMGVRQVRVQG